MHPPHIRRQALRLRAQGVSFGQICTILGLSRNTVGHWFNGDRARRRAELDAEPSRCPRCACPPRAPDDQAAYAYLLGYLGDGHLVTKARVPVLRVFCADAWPGLMDECETAMPAVLARNVQRVQKQGCVAVQSYSKHGHACSPSTGPVTNTVDRSASRHGRRPSSTATGDNCFAGYFTRMAAGLPIE
jgi:hypothetical protein